MLPAAQPVTVGAATTTAPCAITVATGTLIIYLTGATTGTSFALSLTGTFVPGRLLIIRNQSTKTLASSATFTFSPTTTIASGKGVIFMYPATGTTWLVILGI